MSSKIEKLRARMRNMREQTQVIAKNALHSGETLVVGSGVAFAEGRLGDENGEWGYKNVPYAYMGGAALFLTGLFAGERYSADLFAMATGAVGAHLFRSMYESGVESKQNQHAGRRQLRSRVGMGLPQGMRAPQQAPAQRPVYGTALDGLRG